MLSKTLQSAAMTVAAGANAAQKTCSSLEHYREDLEWQRLWQCCQDQARALRVDDPVVPRVRRPPRRFDEGGPVVATLTPEQHLKALFTEFLDNILQTVRRRFDQPSVQFYCDIESTILGAANAGLERDDLEQRLTSICQHYDDDLDVVKLRLNMQMLPVLLENKHVDRVDGVVAALNGLGPAKRLYG